MVGQNTHGGWPPLGKRFIVDFTTNFHGRPLVLLNREMRRHWAFAGPTFYSDALSNVLQSPWFWREYPCQLFMFCHLGPGILREPNKMKKKLLGHEDPQKNMLCLWRYISHSSSRRMRWISTWPCDKWIGRRTALWKVIHPAKFSC